MILKRSFNLEIIQFVEIFSLETQKEMSLLINDIILIIAANNIIVNINHLINT